MPREWISLLRKNKKENIMPFDYKKEFREKVIDDFIECYSNCKTPNPCIECNKYMKFGVMYEKAKELGCNYIATGHYAKTEYSEKYKRWVLKKSKAGRKDQSYVLWNIPKDLIEHVIFPLSDFEAKEEIRKKVKNVLDMVDLEGFEDRKISTLSGGQQQRIAIARALVNEPEILMLDEPLGALDLKMRKEMQIELKNMHDQLGITFIYVTHDQEEALTMSDKIVVLSEGKIQQIGTPEDIYNEPKNAFVADFIGESNIFKGIMTGHMKVRFCGGEFVGMDDVPEGTLVDVVIRPEDVIITKPEDGTVVGEVTSVIFKGMHYEVAVESGKYEMIIRTTRCYHVGDTVGMQLEPDGIHVMIAEDHTTSFVTTINGDYTLDFNGKIISCDLTQVIPKTKMSDGVLVDENGENVDVSKFRVVVSIQPDDIEMSDDVTAGLVSGKIINLIYKGDHYSYVIRTEYGHDLIVDDEYIWNMDDQVGLIMPEEKMKFQLKK